MWLKRPRNQRLHKPRKVDKPRSSLGIVLKRLFFTVFGIATCAGLGFGTWTIWQRVHDAKTLRVHHIVVSGNERITTSEILLYAGVREEDPILGLDLDAMALSLRRQPWISDVRVRRRLPDSVFIDVTEHQPLVLAALGEVYVASDTGQLFKRFAAEDKLVLPVVTGLDRDEVTAHPERTADRILMAGEIVQHTDPTKLGELEELHWDSDLGWSIVTQVKKSPDQEKSFAVRMHLGMQPLPRLSLAERALRILLDHGSSPAVMWVDGAKDSHAVQVRMYDEPSPIMVPGTESENVPEQEKPSTKIQAEGELG